MLKRARNILSPSALTAALFALAALGCDGTSVGNPPGADVKLSVVGTSQAPSEAMARNIGSGITLDEAWLTLKEIGLQATGTCGAEAGSHDAPGPFVAELIGERIFPEPPLWKRLPGETYCELRVKMSQAKEAVPNAPDDLAGHAVLLRGTRADGTPFVVQADVDAKLKVGGKKEPNFSLGDEGVAGLLLAFDLSTWIDPEMLNAAEVTSGVIVINDDSNKELEKSIRKRIPESSRLFRDKDGDGKLNEGDGEI